MTSVCTGVGLTLIAAWFGQASAPPANLPPSLPVTSIPADYPDVTQFIKEHLDYLGAGEIDRAIAMQIKSQGGPYPAETLVALKKQFSTIYGTSGKYTGNEVVGYRRLSSRVTRVYAFCYFDKKYILFTYGFDKRATEWRLTNLSYTDRTADIEHNLNIPLMSMPDKTTQSEH